MMFLKWICMAACICRPFIHFPPQPTHYAYTPSLSKVSMNFGNKEHVLTQCSQGILSGICGLFFEIVSCLFQMSELENKRLWRLSKGLLRFCTEHGGSSLSIPIEASARGMALSCPVRDLSWITTTGYVWCAMCCDSFFT